MKRFALLLGLVLVGCQADPEPAYDKPAVLGIDYTSWPAVSPKRHRVDPGIAMMCRAPTPAEVRTQEAERRDRGPHAEAAIEVRVSPESLDRFKAGQPVPVGTAVIKLKYPLSLPGEQPSAIGAMIKREPGYYPDGGDWEYYYAERRPATEREAVRGKLETCAECHRQAKATDFLFRTYLK
jgi:hypothetical protein